MECENEFTDKCIHIIRKNYSYLEDNFIKYARLKIKNNNYNISVNEIEKWYYDDEFQLQMNNNTSINLINKIKNLQYKIDYLYVLIIAIYLGDFFNHIGIF